MTDEVSFYYIICNYLLTKLFRKPQASTNRLSDCKILIKLSVYYILPMFFISRPAIIYFDVSPSTFRLHTCQSIESVRQTVRRRWIDPRLTFPTGYMGYGFSVKLIRTEFGSYYDKKDRKCKNAIPAKCNFVDILILFFTSCKK